MPAALRRPHEAARGAEMFESPLGEREHGAALARLNGALDTQLPQWFVTNSQHTAERCP